MERWLNKIILGDCLDVMREMPDKCVDLVLTDPPYGIGADEAASKNNGKWGWKFYGNTSWDKERPTREYFDEILRISKNQVIWGGNYFSDYLPPSMCWLVWNKCQRNFSLADGELAWTSYDKALRIYDFSRGAALQDGKVHPTQKPVTLFEWILNRYSKPGDIILDPFLGSGTTVAACINLERQYIGIEISPDYVFAAEQRIKKATAQRRMFL